MKKRYAVSVVMEKALMQDGTWRTWRNYTNLDIRANNRDDAREQAEKQLNKQSEPSIVGIIEL